MQPGQKISSSQFVAGKHAWWLDMYPSGYRQPEHVSVYLHAAIQPNAAESSSAPAGSVVRIAFTLGLYDYIRQQFEPLANLMQTFTPKVRCWGKHNFVLLDHVLQHDQYLDRDTLILCVDIATTVDRAAQVVIFLHHPKPFARHCAQCLGALGFKRSKRQCHHCGKVFCGNCCASERPIADFGFDYPVRVCNACAAVVDSSATDEIVLWGNSARWRPADADARASVRSHREDAAVQVLGGLWFPDALTTHCANRSCARGFGAAAELCSTVPTVRAVPRVLAAASHLMLRTAHFRIEMSDMTSLPALGASSRLWHSSQCAGK
jgi:hypothetical protein